MSSNRIVYDATADLERSRVSVFFRIILAIPHFFVAAFIGIGVAFSVIVAWFALLITGRYPAGLYGFVSGALRYYARLSAYLYILVDKYPPFDLGEHPEYPVRLHIAPAQESYDRLKVLFRFLLLIPVYVINYVLNLVGELIACLLWLSGVILGRTPAGLTDIQRFCLSYGARAACYFALVSEDWPSISQDESAVPAGVVPSGFAAPGAGVAPPPPPPPPAAPGPTPPPPPPPGPNPFGS